MLGLADLFSLLWILSSAEFEHEMHWFLSQVQPIVKDWTVKHIIKSNWHLVHYSEENVRSS